MAHELVVVNGKAAMAFVGETPWHGLGQELTDNASIETWKQEAGFDWDINSSPVQYKVGDGSFNFNGKTVLHRSDNGAPLSIVSNDYKIVQPAEVLEFFRDLVGAAGMKLNTAGVLFGGRRFWAMAETNNWGVLNGNDAIKGNLLLTTSCDLSTPSIATFCAERVVCNNTLRVALDENNSGRVRVSHSRQFDQKEIKAKLGLINESWETFMEKCTNLSQYEISVKKANDFVFDLVSDKNRAVDKQKYSVEDTMVSIMNKFKNGMGNEGKTMWDVVNAVTEHYGTEMGRVKSADVKLWNNFYGKDANVKDLAFDKAVDYIAA